MWGYVYLQAKFGQNNQSDWFRICSGLFRPEQIPLFQDGFSVCTVSAEMLALLDHQNYRRVISQSNLNWFLVQLVLETKTCFYVHHQFRQELSVCLLLLIMLLTDCHVTKYWTLGSRAQRAVHQNLKRAPKTGSSQVRVGAPKGWDLIRTG